MASVPGITFATFEMIEKYLDETQARYVKDNSEADSMYPVSMHFEHNETDVRTEFIINSQGNRVLVDLPFDVFNNLPVATVNATVQGISPAPRVMKAPAPDRMERAPEPEPTIDVAYEEKPKLRHNYVPPELRASD